jgi:hypothetical protein
MASIQPARTGFRVHYQIDGRQRASPVQASRAAAEAWMAEHLPALQTHSVAQLADLWSKEAPSPHRTEAALRIGQAATARGWVDVRRLDLAELRAWARQASPRYGQYLATILRWAAEVHHAPVRADALAWKPGTYKRQAPLPLLTDAQADAIRTTSRLYGRRAVAVIDYLLTYGARPITACQLLRSDLDTSRGELVIRDAKHSGGWRHALHDRHVETWSKLTSDPAGPLFPHYLEDRPWRLKRGGARELCNWFRGTIGKRLKLGRQNSIYHLKRYAITTMLRRSVDPATVALFTGHLDLQQVLRYAKSNSDVQRAALALLK